MKQSLRQYRGKLAKSLRGLRRRYRSSLRAQGDAYAEWLRDNYYMLERETRSVLRELRTVEKQQTRHDRSAAQPMRMLALCRQICAGGNLPTGEQLTEALLRAKPSGAEAEWTPLALRCALAEAALGSRSAPPEQRTALLSGAVKAFRTLPDLDFDAILEQINPLERLLRKDPAGAYHRMEEGSRALYRRLLAARAAKAGRSAEEEARALLAQTAGRQEGDPARHIGVPLLRGAAHPRRGKALLWLESLLPLPLAAVAACLLGAWFAAPLLLLPLWAVCRVLLEALFLRGVQPVPLPRLELGGKIPPEGRTVITVSTLLPGAAKAKELGRRMEELAGSNGGENVLICVLADLKAAALPVQPQDAADIAAACREVTRLNQKYGGGFLLALRPRVYSPTMGQYCGWERKRGAVLQLARLLRGETGAGEGFLTLCGDQRELQSCRYILALDADTQLPLETAAELVAAALHPANQPQFDPALGRVRTGYGILAPQVGLDLESALATPFAHAMAGEGGISPYANLVSERYQDLFGSGIFAGKGLLDIDAFLAVAAAHPFPAEQVLSHDVLEGGYLRAGFMADVQLTDGFPGRQRSYFTRQERWVRGDWQNTPFLRKKRGLPPLNRYQLFDNLRRSLLAPGCLLALLCSLWAPPRVAAALCLAAVLGLCGGCLLSALRALGGGGAAMLARRYYAGGLPAALGDLVRGSLQLLTLAQAAWANAAGAARGLWRSFVSGKKRLEWTTAAQGETGGGVWLDLLPSLLAGGLLLAFGGAWQRLLGLVLLADLLFAPLSARKRPAAQTQLHPEERERLTGYCAAMWNYFETYCTEEHNFLPPDNVQETPVYRVAPRSSPTNLGLYLLCTLAARDLDFLSTTQLAQRLERTLGSIEQLERWHGNLLNWYDTRTLRPLEPRYVSTVDSGNFLCCLRALRSGLGEYLPEEPRLAALCQRLRLLEEGCDLRPLYHARRRLFHIGVDLSTGKPSASYYDLLMSEARMTGYYAIARRMIPKKHWGALGRTLASSGRFTGPVSWTGTMFEYFMPYLFLPAPRGTLGYEALRFSLGCQQKRVRSLGRQGAHLPWGNSESGFYAFDAGLNYQYKAHGVQKLGLRRGLDEELVLAPYASFLAMQLAPRSALANLRRFERMELWGKCGFYEAADATPGRTAGQDYAVVRSYMAHHVGMSFLAALNTLQGGVLRRRFLEDEEMAGARSLLLERIPDHASVFRDVEIRETRRPQERFGSGRTVLSGIDPAAPHARLLTNGEWSCVITDAGASVSFYQGASVLRHSPDLLRRPGGVLAFLHEDDAPQSEQTRTAEFGANEVTHTLAGARVQLCTRTSVHPRLPAEERRYTLKNTARQPAAGHLTLYFEPSLAPLNEEAAHPAFSKLFLEDQYDPAQGVLTFTRNRAEGETLCLAAALSRGVQAACERLRTHAFSGGAGQPDLAEDANGSQSGNPDCCGAFRVPYALQPGESREFSLYLCAGSEPEEATSRLHRLRGEEEHRRGSRRQGAPCPFREGEMAAALAESVLPRLFFYAPATPKELEIRAQNTARKQALWPLGISGDEPYLYFLLQGEQDASAALPYLSLFRRLRAAGLPCELVLAYREGGDYDTPVANALHAALRREGCQHLANQRGGVHLVNLNHVPQPAAQALPAYAACGGLVGCAAAVGALMKPLADVSAMGGVPGFLMQVAAGEDPTAAAGFTQDGFTIPAAARPAVPWCLPLANRSFGTLVSDRALGFTWAVNARENKLTPWYNDPCTDNRGELLLLRFGNRLYDLLPGSRAEFYPHEARWFGELHGLAYEITVYVPERGCAKRCDVRLQNRTDRSLTPELAYYLEPVLGVRREPHSPILGEALPDGALLHAPDAAMGGFTALLLAGGADFVCSDRAAFCKGQWRGGGGWPQADPCAAVGRRLNIPPGEEVTAAFSLAWGKGRNAALCAHLVAERDPMAHARARLTIATPSAALNHMINTWLPQQILHSRLFGRTGFSQCGGAWGFRDQLQDVSALCMTHPELVRVQICRCAAAQFPEGDVLHWWHRIPGEGVRGVRTRYSDDLLWLPCVCAEYVEKTGDTGILDTRIPFREGALLRAEEAERYALYPQSCEKAGLYEHCIRAVEHALGAMGEHGLPRIGGGDWNDGFNLVGAKGRGESVWLGMFLAQTLEKTAALCRLQSDEARAERYLQEAARLRTAIDTHAWAGDRYLRAFWDDGSPMGGSGNEPCSIDLLPQAFAALCHMPDPVRRNQALETAVARLADPEHRILRLLREPFTRNGKRAGYINAYPPGIRENGGQYTHAAVWLCLALLAERRADEAWALLQMLNPAELCNMPEALARYRGEPYALAGDVSGAPGKEGQAGWTLYTGAAAWYYRTIVEGMLGLQEEDGKLVMKTPCLPADWAGKVRAVLTLRDGTELVAE
ncbi:MAG: DUF3131 domain-containing protein [Oscillospiraceae bacterium]|jgi:cyclic beta-1,2-glucan synthetase|nr:DUF3131 domain-containing protein [Oscillospiraceae bacterium]